MKRLLISAIATISVLVVQTEVKALEVCVEKNTNATFYTEVLKMPIRYCKENERLLLPRTEKNGIQGVKNGIRKTGQDLKRMSDNLSRNLGIRNRRRNKK